MTSRRSTGGASLGVTTLARLSRTGNFVADPAKGGSTEILPRIGMVTHARSTTGNTPLRQLAWTRSGHYQMKTLATTRLGRVQEGHLTHLQDQPQDSPEAETSLLVARLPVGQTLEGLSVRLVHHPRMEQGGVLLEAGVVVAYVPLELPTPGVDARSHSRHRCLLLPSRRHR